MLHGFPLVLGALLSSVNALVCDIYASGGTPCVAAHSTVRSLYSSFTGPMYQVKRSDGTTKDIHPLSAGGIADASSQDSFCSASSCVISIIYDQSGKGNHLTPAPGGGAKRTPDNPANAAKLSLTIQGKKAYGVWIDGGMGYRNDRTTGIAKGDQAEAMYMLTSGSHFNGGCCFDYGNAETDNNDDGAATMEAVYFGNIRVWGYGTGPGPWLMADLENGLFGCSATHSCPNLPTVSYPYVTAMVKGRSGGTFALKQGNGQSGGLTTVYDGPRPNGYTVMKKQGAIILGIGGDNSNGAIGSFYEGVMVTGNPGNDIDDKVQADIVAAGYGSTVTQQPTSPVPTSNSPTPEPSTSAPAPTSKPPAPSTKTPAPTNSGGAKKWGQCGGNGWTGPTTCAEGTCKKLNDWYSQCV